MSELGQYGAYLSDRAKQSVTSVVRLYSAGLEAAYPDLRLTRVNLVKKEVEILLDVAIRVAVNGGISFRELVTEFLAVASEVYKEDEDAPF